MSAIAQRAFSGGEIAPSLYARTDVAKYGTAVRTMRNMLTMRHGGTQNRGGLVYINEVKDSTKRVRLVPFEFNSEQTYVLEFGNLYMRVIRSAAQVVVSGVTAWSGATAYVIGDLASRLGVNYYCILGHTNQQPPNATYWYALTSTIYEIPTPYVEADLQELNFIQSADVVTITHPSYAPRELARSAHTTWTLTAITFAPGISAPTSPANTGAAGSATEWVITSVASETYEESLQSTATGSSATPSSGSPITVSWVAASGAAEYNVYKKSNGVYGFIGVAVGTSFIDNGIDADTSDTPPTSRNPFSGADNYPCTATYYQQRLGMANTNNDTEKCWFGRSAQFKNFTISSPLQDDDAVTFNLAGRQVNAVRHMVDLSELVVLTSGGEYIIKGSSDGILLPGAINPRQQSYNGCAAHPAPLILNTSLLYVQAEGSVVRDLSQDVIEGYKGNDLTIYSAHLFDGYTITDWALQKVPNQIVWAVRSDGDLVAVTYNREQQMLAWHHHDTHVGTFENVCVVAESNRSILYAVVNRTIDGNTVRYIERMEPRFVSDIKDARFMDSSLTYDGRNLAATTMTLSGGSTWAYDESLTLTASASAFVAGDVGNEVQMNGSDGSLIRCVITAYTSATVVTVTPNKTVPDVLRTTAITDWALAVDTITGLDHLEGEDVVIMGDGFVVANPNNPAYTVRTVASGSVTLDRPYAVVHVGLPFLSDIETLDIDTPSGETLANKKIHINQVTVFLEASRGLWVGPKPPSDDADDATEFLTELKIRSTEGYDEPVALTTDKHTINILPEWNSNGRVFLRQIDPLPFTLLSVMPAGHIPVRS